MKRALWITWRCSLYSKLMGFYRGSLVWIVFLEGHVLDWFWMGIQPKNPRSNMTFKLNFQVLSINTWNPKGWKWWISHPFLIISHDLVHVTSIWKNNLNWIRWFFRYPYINVINESEPGDSKCPFHPLVGGHLTPWKGHLTIPKRSLWITWNIIYSSEDACADSRNRIRKHLW